jgi:hypothetical protein
MSHRGQQHVVMPPGVVVGRGVQNDVHEGTNVRHSSLLDVEVGDNGVFIRRRVGRELLGRGRRESQDQFLGGGGLPFEIDGGGLLLIKELTGGHDVTTRGGNLLLDSFIGRKRDDERWHEVLRRGGWACEQCDTVAAVL